MYYKNKWVIAATPGQIRENGDVGAIARDLDVTLPTAQLLYNRGCTSAEAARRFLAKEEEQLHDPYLMKDMDKAVKRILQSMKDGEKIVIYGDYDVDGVTSVSSLYLYLQSCGAQVDYYIPCRSGEGYGVSEGAIRKLYEDGCRLIITVDTGITAAEEAKVAKELGMGFVVTDHHECHGDLPVADAVVNPRRPDCPYPFKELAGVGVVFKLLCALEMAQNPQEGAVACVRRVSKVYGDLVAIGTVADVMPLQDENRLIVSYGLALIDDSDRPGLIELIDASSATSRYNTKRKITASFIGYTIAPRINAAGRIRDASLAVELFLAPDCETAAPIAKELCDINHQRQEAENAIVEQAYAKIAMEHDFEKDPVVVLDHETWHHGVIGIVASRVTEKYGCPSILISFEGSPEGRNADDMGKGSGRSVKGLNLVEVLSSCSDLLEKFGGHELAAGLSIKRENLPLFRRRINERARECLGEADRTATLYAECELTPEDVTMEQANQLYYLEPYGASNPVPVFALRNIMLYDVTLVGGGKHTRLTLKIGNNYVKAMCFRSTLSELDVYPGDEVDLLFTLDVNEFQNQKSLQLIVKDVRLSEEQFGIENAERALYESMRHGSSRDEIGLDPLSAQSLIPDRNDFAAVYKTLCKELRVEHEIFSVRALQHLLKSSGIKLGYVKLRYILEIFNELNLIGVCPRDDEKEIFVFRYIYQHTKTNLDKSSIYKKLKSDYGHKM